MKNRFNAIKKKILEHKYKNLNPVQRDVVFNVNGPTLILAGAGSGKTTTITNRISYMVKYGDSYNNDFSPNNLSEEMLCEMENADFNSLSFFQERFLSYEPISPYNILAITFTNKAACEMRERVEKLLGGRSLDMWVLTFHSACVRILRQDIERLGYEKSFAIFDSTDSKTLVKDCMNELNLDEKIISYRVFQSYISSFKDKYINCDEAQNETDGNPVLEQTVKVYKLYQEKLKKYNALDFDDILFLTVKLFKEHQDILKKWQDRFKYIIVDEYQDTSKTQYMFISLLSQESKNICVVGDDDQSIYKFRGADISNILSFEKQFKNCSVIKLEQNYRSTGNILEAANSVISNNTLRKSKSLWTDSGEGEKITLIMPYNERDEASLVGEYIEGYVDEGKKYSDIAILYRTNAQSRAIEENFLRNAIPHRVIGGTRFFDRKEIKDIIAYMRVAFNINDDLSLKRIVNEPKRGLGKTAIEKMDNIARIEEKSIFQILERVEIYPELSRYHDKLRDFVKLIHDFQVELDDLEGFVNIVINGSGYLDMLKAEDTIENRGRIDNIKELLSMVKDFKENEEEPTVTNFLENMALLSDIDNYDEGEDAVVLMTMHGAKGLEFPIVFLVGVEDGLFPSTRSMNNPEDLEEERRLCYVGITRAKEKLYLSTTSSRTMFGMTMPSRPSRFLGEIPTNLIERMVNEKENKASNNRSYKKPIAPSVSSSFKDNKFTKPSANLDFVKGDRVKHAKFGAGTIDQAEKLGADVKFTIIFDELGKKVLMGTFAKLEKL